MVRLERLGYVIDHELLLAELCKIAMRGNTLMLIKSYLNTDHKWYGSTVNKAKKK